MAAVSYPPCVNPACEVGAVTKDDTNDNLSKCALADKCVEACAAYGRVCPCSARAAGRAAHEAVRKLKENSKVFNSESEPQMTQLNADDLVIGKEKLGEGGFSLVHACTLKTDPERKLAIKYLKRKVMVNQRTFEHGAADLAQEAHFLSVLDHPHIIKLHGVTAGSVDTNVATGKECGFFITMERLSETLEHRLEKWREEDKKNQKGVLGRMTSEYKEKKKEEMKDRVRVMLQIADAMEYLHNKGIIFRDLKPDNIAYDANGVLKLFDFGLAKELKPGQGKPDGRYELTGNTGSRRYMSPEVAKELPYNKSVDAYSFGIMLHEVLTAEKPFYGYSSGKHMSMVVMGGERPNMNHKAGQHWPMNLQWLMKRCWSPFPTSRPDFATIKQTLQDVLDDKDEVPDIRQLGTRSLHTHSTRKMVVEPPPSGFAALLKPKFARGQSHDHDSASSGSASPLKQHRGRSWGWVFRK